MANPIDIERAQRGRTAWNSWASREIAAGNSPEVDFSRAQLTELSFVGFLFPGVVNFSQATFVENANFTNSTFKGDAKFESVTFLRQALFEAAQFKAATSFDNARFSDAANFHNTICSRRATFTGAQFSNTAVFSNSKFIGTAGFGGTRFSSDARFDQATFLNAVGFRRAAFSGAADFAATVFSDTTAFSRATFSHDARFHRAKFYGGTKFTHARFNAGVAGFHGASFFGSTSFGQARFASEVRFSSAKFTNDATFEGATFDGYLNEFDGAVFAHVPDFRMARFAVPPNLHGITVQFAAANADGIIARLFGRAANPKDAACYRRLKQLAAEGKDYDRELIFFGMELRAKRFHEIQGLWPIALNTAYGSLSDYGKSSLKPSVWLATMTILAGAIIALPRAVATQEFFATVSASMVLSLTNAALLIGSDKWLLRANAFAAAGYGSEKSFGLFGEVLAYVQSGFSLLLLFLIGLALRNRFRIGGNS